MASIHEKNAKKSRDTAPLRAVSYMYVYHIIKEKLLGLTGANTASSTMTKGLCIIRVLHCKISTWKRVVGGIPPLEETKNIKNDFFIFVRINFLTPAHLII